jgi:hypothetical protein
MGDGVDVVARVLAIIGAVTGIAGLTIALLTYRRDRSLLRLSWEASESLPELEVSTVNVGRQPVALRSVYAWGVRIPLWVRFWSVVRPFRRLIEHFRGSLVYGDALIVEPTRGDALPHVLQPGDVHTCTFEASRLLRLAESPRGAWIIATNILGKQVAQAMPNALVDVLRTSTRGR